LSVIRDCLFNIFTATLQIGGLSSIRNLSTGHAVVTDSLITAPASATQNKTQRVVFFALKDFMGLEESIIYEE
jgi:hypothetical protein